MKTNKRLERISSISTSNWKEKTIFRRNNKWLRYSSQIARRILAIIEGNEELSQQLLASKLNVSRQQISKIVQGQENLTLETIYKLSQALGHELISFPPYKYNVVAPMHFAQNAVGGTTQLYYNYGHFLHWNPNIKEEHVLFDLQQPNAIHIYSEDN